MIRRGIRFLLLGDSERPPLPAGWGFAASGHFVVARAPMGQQFFIEASPERFRLIPLMVATWEDVVRTEGRLKVGQIFADTDAKTYGTEFVIERSAAIAIAAPGPERN